MELIINISLRANPGNPVQSLEDVRIQDLYAKSYEDVMDEVQEHIDNAVQTAFDELGLEQ